MQQFPGHLAVPVSGILCSIVSNDTCCYVSGVIHAEYGAAA